jgi:hypothetical protein
MRRPGEWGGQRGTGRGGEGVGRGEGGKEVGGGASTSSPSSKRVTNPAVSSMEVSDAKIATLNINWYMYILNISEYTHRERLIYIQYKLVYMCVCFEQGSERRENSHLEYILVCI